MKRAFCISVTAFLLIPLALQAQIREEYLPFAQMLSTLPEREPTEGNLVEILNSTPELFIRMQDDMMAARESIHMEYFIFDADDAGNIIRTAMRLKALDGVEVQYIAEDFTQNAAFMNNMRRSGVSVKHHPLIPVRRRNHQKFLLIDGTVGYTGGMNIARENMCDWEDMAVRVRGPVVAKMEQVYAKMWKRRRGKPSAYEIKEAEPYEGGVIVQSVDEDPSEKNHQTLQAYLWAINNAKEYFYVKSPYFKPPQELADALSAAARRGVEVRLMIPQTKDAPARLVEPLERVYYEVMIKAGVHLHMRTDMFDHSKMFVTDDYLSAVGSVNLDNLSMLYNYENNLYFYDKSIAAQVKAFIEDDFDKCYEYTLDHLAAIAAWEKTFKWGLRAFGKIF